MSCFTYKCWQYIEKRKKRAEERASCSFVFLLVIRFTYFLLNERVKSVHGNDTNSVYEKLQRAHDHEIYKYFRNEVFFLLDS